LQQGKYFSSAGSHGAKVVFSSSIKKKMHIQQSIQAKVCE
jgi:hypothetical protein